MVGARRAALVGAAWIAALVGLSSSAAAQSSQPVPDQIHIEARGEAEITTQSVPANARTRALDRAFAAALGRVLDDLVAADARQQYQRELTARVIRRARRYVRSFRVLEEGEQGGRLRVRIAASVDVAALRPVLTEIGITAVSGRAVAPMPVTESGSSRGGRRPAVAVFIRANYDGEVQYNYGASGRDGGVFGQSFLRLLDQHGYQVAAAAGVAADPEPQALLPLSDRAAVELARHVGAGGAFIVDFTAEPEGLIRATRFVGATGRAAIRVLDAASQDGELIAQIRASSAGFAETIAAAFGAAADDTALQLVANVAVAVDEYWPPQVSVGDDAMTIEIRGYRDWSSVAALLQHLAATRGIRRVWPVELGSRGVALAVESDLDQRRLLSVIRRAQMPASQRMVVRKTGQRELEVEVRGP